MGGGSLLLRTRDYEEDRSVCRVLRIGFLLLDMAMKGPLGRGKYDFRRLWQCPRCGWRCFSTGAVVNLTCSQCSTPELHINMRLENEEPRPFLPEPTSSLEQAK